MNLLSLLLFLLGTTVLSLRTGFWYGDTRPPDTQYETVPFANLTVKINRPYQDGPGQNLVKDPFNPKIPLYVGNTINRQTFDTQFILDLAYAIGIETERIFVMYVSKGKVHYTWESDSVIVNFIFLERNSTQSMTLLEAIAELTNQIQIPKSPLYIGTNVTSDIDPNWGLEVITWDVSLKLTYAIDVIGGNSVIDHYYLNQGSLGLCDHAALSMNHTQYCEFERFFEDDVARALNISFYRVQVLFVKAASLDAVIVHFRILPQMNTKHEANVKDATANLIRQTADMTSPLYFGNVTIRTDSIWGVNEFMGTHRTSGALFTRSYYEYDPSRIYNNRRKAFITAYDRCKANRRCNWGILELDQSTNDARFFHRLFTQGTLYGVTLFLDFENWRMGGRGLTWYGNIPPTALGATSIPKARVPAGIIRGAHFFPFEQRSLGPRIPCYLTETNEGLVLNRNLQYRQVVQQEDLIDDLQGRIDWLEKNIEVATMGSDLRARKDVRRNLTWVRADYMHWQQNEVGELKVLNSSQCIYSECHILFNTSSLELSGAINDVGVVKKTVKGTEVALFTFNSIYLGPEVRVTVVGQRALALLSKTSLIINTTIQATPGTLGGFQGGRSVARLAAEALNDTPQPIYICDLNHYCSNSTDSKGTQISRTFEEYLVSNNVNGPGSGNLRVNPFIVKTFTSNTSEIQTITTFARNGQTLSGGFVISFKEFSTPILPHDASALLVKQAMEDNLNLINPNSFPISPNRNLQAKAKGSNYNANSAGVGIVNVTRSGSDTQEGYTWTITFTTTIGNIEQLRVKSYLFGIGANVTSHTVRDGNEIGGTFRLTFQGITTPPIPAAASATELKAVLLQLPMVVTAFVQRTDPTNNCDDGLCANGPYPGRGLLWTCYVTTNYHYDDISPTSPTSPVAKTEAPHYRITADGSELTGLSSSVEVYYGTAQSPYNPLNLMKVTIPFSLAFGGGGGSYGGIGGKGYSENPVGDTYNDEQVSDLVGGSGGCMSLGDVFQINAALGSVPGTGGNGGGAVELIAGNDLIIGEFGKLIMRGQDGEQTSFGGGGGGSGGTILLTSGTTIVVKGTLDVTGGDGGYGGSSVAGLSGGGGGGGRIALYADSITTKTATIVKDGGKCGIYTTPVNESSLIVTLGVNFTMTLPTLDADLANVASQHIKRILGNYIDLVVVSQVDNNIPLVEHNGTHLFFAYVFMDVTKYRVHHNNTVATLTHLKQLLKNFELSANIGEIFYENADILSFNFTHLSHSKKIPTDCSNDGHTGTYYTQAYMTSSMFVGDFSNTDGYGGVGAEQTQRALFISNRETTFTVSGSKMEAPFAGNGPIISFEPTRPTRITYYTKTNPVPGESVKADYGSLFTLLSRGEAGLNISNVIGVYFGTQIMQGANFGSAVDEKYFLKRLVAIDPYPTVNEWYKVDIKIQWDNHTYSVALNDTIVTSGQNFIGDDVDGIRLSVYRSVDVWYDEIYVGFDNAMEFQCPLTRRKGTSTIAPVQRGWSFSEVHGGNSNGYTQYKQMMRHYNFLETTGSIPFDGQGQVTDFQDIKLQYADGDYPLQQGKIHAGALVYLTNSVRSQQTPLAASATLASAGGSGTIQGLWDLGGGKNHGDGRQFWYTEYNYESIVSGTLNGGIAACSTQDLNSWRFEGIVFHYANASDMVLGRSGPYYMERPKVLFNELTKEYVMWATLDNSSRTLAMSIIASSPYEDGPFLFRRSFYPDGNQTRDQVIFVNEENQPVLARTYYQTVEFILPEAMMQPVWESAKSQSGKINYRSNYHRAVYDIGYDNYNDIYNQIWRKEDIPYEVICRNKITGVDRPVPSGTYNSDGFICNDPEEEKIVIGQGNPIITTRFVSPNDSTNSWWRPTSVPNVKAQDWSANYRDGYCGIRKLNDDYATDDPNLANFKPTPRDSCSNIADNPVHETMPDKIIGLLRVVLSRRAKYIALSHLTDDYLDTNGFLTTYEGEFDAGNLISLITNLGQFGFGSGNKINSTFAQARRSDFDTAVDYRIRFSQYIQNINDRASYSLACVLDGVCPVNFKNQLTAGNY